MRFSFICFQTQSFELIARNEIGYIFQTVIFGIPVMVHSNDENQLGANKIFSLTTE